jgi:hypothetical protein
MDDYDKLASAMVAGHIIECGAQASGGNYSDWHLVKNWHNIGYPIIEMSEDGSFCITKHNDTGGLINVNTIKEQLLYEMGNPKAFIGPDVVADITRMRINLSRYNRVSVSNVYVYPPTPFLKVSVAYMDGYKAVGSLVVTGGDIDKKAKIIEDIIWNKIDLEFRNSNFEIVGYNSCHSLNDNISIPTEAVLRISVYDEDIENIKQFTNVFSSLILSAPAGVAIIGSKPRIQEVITYWPCLVKKKNIISKLNFIDSNGETIRLLKIPCASQYDKILKISPISYKNEADEKIDSLKTINLINTNYKSLCLARSGDKGDSVNIGIIARDQNSYDFLLKNLTSVKMKEIFEGLCLGKISRYEIPKLLSFNFILEKSLGGGGLKSLRIDPQGKTFAEIFLNYSVEIPDNILE